jgi:hypothetical protein
LGTTQGERGWYEDAKTKQVCELIVPIAFSLPFRSHIPFFYILPFQIGFFEITPSGEWSFEHGPFDVVRSFCFYQGDANHA